MGLLDTVLGWVGLTRIPRDREGDPMRNQVLLEGYVAIPPVQEQVVQMAYAQGEDDGRRSLISQLEKIVFERNPNACQFEAEDVESLRRGMLH